VGLVDHPGSSLPPARSWRGGSLLIIGSNGMLLSPKGKGSDDFLTALSKEFVRDGRGGGTREDCNSNEVLRNRLISS